MSISSLPCIQRKHTKPAYQTVLTNAESRPPQTRTFCQMCKEKYHGYSRWIARRAKKITGGMNIFAGVKDLGQCKARPLRFHLVYFIYVFFISVLQQITVLAS